MEEETLCQHDVLKDKELSPQSKAIYFILLTKAQGSNFLQVYRDELLTDLCTTNRGYYPHLQPLLDKGYIQRLPQPKEKPNLFGPTLFRFPKKQYIPLWDEGVMYAKLPLKAKALYVYYCAHSDGYSRRMIFRPEAMADLNIPTRRTYAHLRNTLEEYGAIRAEKLVLGDRIMRPASYMVRNNCP